MKNSVYALIDCNNFFASCERVFNPSLEGKPIAVLSNNDGCIIARSQEVKSLGIKMGAPVHKFKHVIEQNHVHLFSANFQLYGDISNRVMQILKEFCPDIEIYSIDEAFLDLANTKIKDYEEFGFKIRKTIQKCLGITTSVGIGKTKTLAKIANHKAKKSGVCVLLDDEVIDKNLGNMEVGEIWGIGWRYSEFLNKNGIYTALQLKQLDDRWAKSNMSVVGQRVVFELRGIPCIKLEANIEGKKTIMSSRSFGKSVTKLGDLEESVATYIGRAAEKLRHQKSVCNQVVVSIITNRHKANEQQYYGSELITLPNYSSYDPDLIKYALKALKRIYIPGLYYKKAAVLLLGLIPEDSIQLNLFDKDYPFDKRKDIMKVFDKINKQWGREKIKIASQGLNQTWKVKRDHVSPSYTMSWEELPVVQI